MSARPRVTVIQHDANVPLDRFAGWLDDLDIRLVRAWDGERVPSLSDAGEGLLILGGRMNAYDDERAPWLPATRGLIADSVDAGLPLLGICLGHQLIAAATGGQVAVPASQGKEAGLVEITWRPEAADDPLLGAVVAGDVDDGDPRPQGTAPARSYQYAMHDDGVTQLPPGAVGLASSERYPVQVMRMGSAMGVQFHPEASPDLIGRWAERNGSSGTASVGAAVSGEHDGEVARTARAIARSFAAQVRDGAPG